MSEPEYTKGKRSLSRSVSVNVDEKQIYEVYGSYTEDDEDEGNARLAKASDSAVIELAEHLGCNAVLLAERLEGGGLVRLVEAAQRYAGTVNALTRGHPDEAQSSDEARIALAGQIAATNDIAAALSHLTTPAPRRKETDMNTNTRTPVADMTDADIQSEWEGFMWADAIGEFQITDAQRARHREVEQEIARRRPTPAPR